MKVPPLDSRTEPKMAGYWGRLRAGLMASQMVVVTEPLMVAQRVSSMVILSAEHWGLLLAAD